MALREFDTLTDLQAAVGEKIGPTGWVTLDQEAVNAFGEITGDLNWVHVDAERAASSAYGTTIAHGFFTLALIGRFSPELVAIRELPTTINYGLDRVRFPAPCPSGSRVRATAELVAVEAVDAGCRLSLRYVIEREGADRPVCVADQLSLRTR